MKKKRKRHSLWAIWHGMWQRCTNPRRSDYKYYGERGIVVCPAWESLKVFVGDMGARPSPQHTLDRIDNNGPYCPYNCRWATRREQQQNNRNAILVTHKGVTKTLSGWARHFNCSLSGLAARWHKHGRLV
jgi:hypothetical protein